MEGRKYAVSMALARPAKVAVVAHGTHHGLVSLVHMMGRAAGALREPKFTRLESADQNQRPFERELRTPFRLGAFKEECVSLDQGINVMRAESAETDIRLKDEAAFEAPTRLLQERVVLRRGHTRLWRAPGELGEYLAEGLDVHTPARRKQCLHRLGASTELAQALESLLMLDIEP